MRVWWIECVKCGRVKDKYSVIKEANLKSLFLINHLHLINLLLHIFNIIPQNY